MNNLINSTVVFDFHPTGAMFEFDYYTHSGEFHFYRIGKIERSEIIAFSTVITEQLKLYQRFFNRNNERSLEALYKIMEAGFSFSCHLMNSIGNPSHKKMIAEFLSGGNDQYNTHVIIKLTNEHLSLPMFFCFFYKSQAKTRKLLQDLKLSNQKKTAKNFLGYKYTFSLERQDIDIYHQKALANKLNRDTSNLLHAIDDRIFKNSIELNSILEHNIAINSAHTTDELFRLWNTPKHPPHIVHFSTHYLRKPVPSLRLTNGRVTAVDINTRIKSRRAAKPLVFLNSCKSGVLIPDAGTALANLIFPCLSDGLIVTHCDVHHAVASNFPLYFYELFLEGTSLSKSLGLAKKQIYEETSNITAISYFLFEAYANLVFYQQI